MLRVFQKVLGRGMCSQPRAPRAIPLQEQELLNTRALTFNPGPDPAPHTLSRLSSVLTLGKDSEYACKRVSLSSNSRDLWETDVVRLHNRRQRVNPLGTRSLWLVARDLASQLQPPCGEASWSQDIGVRVLKKCVCVCVTWGQDKSIWIVSNRRRTLLLSFSIW
jgi:hypothetical protein